MNQIHKNLASGRWNNFSLVEQLANVGSEVGRAISWRGKNREFCTLAAERALELAELTISDPKNKKKLKELVRLRETLADYFFGSNEYSSSDQLWQNYFLAFNWAARRGK
jgi:uncharacterized protein YozE (UPF0346 family)